jgi:phosphoglycolate phosphatase
VAVSLLLFDLDGTLSDSAPGILASLRHAFAANGIAPLDPETERTLLGPPFYTSLPPLIGGEDKLWAVIDAYREHYTGGSMFDTVSYDGMEDVLKAARAAGVRMAVATSKPEPSAVPIVEHLGFTHYFETIGGDELDGSLGTKALVIDKVLTRLAANPLGRPDPQDILMIGDREHDVFGAREHGIACIGAGWGYGTTQELTDAGAMSICATPLDLMTELGLAAPGASDAPTS